MVKIYFSHDGVCIFFEHIKMGHFKKMARDEISNIKERETETVQRICKTKSRSFDGFCQTDLFCSIFDA